MDPRPDWPAAGQFEYRVRSTQRSPRYLGMQNVRTIGDVSAQEAADQQAFSMPE